MTKQYEEELESVIASCRPQLELFDAFDRLHKNKDFIAVITDGYLRDYAAKQVSNLADPGCNKTTVQEGLQGIAELLAYFRAIEAGAMVARRTKEEHEEALNELNSVENV